MPYTETNNEWEIIMINMPYLNFWWFTGMYVDRALKVDKEISLLVAHAKAKKIVLGKVKLVNKNRDFTIAIRQNSSPHLNSTETKDVRGWAV